MSSGGLQDFTAGAPPEAALLDALVCAVRALMAQQGPQTIINRSGRAMRVFTPSGRGLVYTSGQNAVTAHMSEFLWQLGPHVKVLPCAPIANAKNKVSSGLYADFEYIEHKLPEGAEFATGQTIEPDPDTVTCAAAETTGSAHLGYHPLGFTLDAAGVRGQWQRALHMWPMPQHPCVVMRDGYHCGVWGERALLPAAACEQIITRDWCGYYASMTPGDRYTQWAEWLGRLDKHGRFEIKASKTFVGKS